MKHVTKLYFRQTYMLGTHTKQFYITDHPGVHPINLPHAYYAIILANPSRLSRFYLSEFWRFSSLIFGESLK